MSVCISDIGAEKMQSFSVHLRSIAGHARKYEVFTLARK